MCIIENGEDVDDRLRDETWNCGAADVMDSDNSVAENRIHYRGFPLESFNPGWIIVCDFNYA